jgi:hypothetical protein
MPTPKRLQVGSKADPQQTSLASRFGQDERNGRSIKFEWSGTNPVLLAEVVTKVVRAGDAVMFGRTLDGGAGVATILSGNDRKRFYPPNDVAAEQTLMQISYAYSTAEERRDFPSDFVPIGGKR